MCATCWAHRSKYLTSPNAVIQASRLRDGSAVGMSVLRRMVAAASRLRPRAPIEETALFAGAFAAAPLRAVITSRRSAAQAEGEQADGADVDAARVALESPWRNRLRRQATPQPLSFPRMYCISEGDTLWGIAESAYGDGQRFADILAANPGAPWHALLLLASARCSRCAAQA